ncbi:hypothetical protein [Parasitella parasitica]|uniref:Tc1-like transposase DDE domain-containing protein n=1 Tax=Parasitella parasitica TaxID=35722 RepID=A0A0B7N0F6_9FUNG|nr:hypothetical protein [Parasitella parasitica]
MSLYYEDGQGSIADEQGNEAMDYEEDTDPYNVTSFLTASQYRIHQGRFPAKVTEELDVQMEEVSEELFQDVATVKIWNAAASGRKAQVEIRTAQKWAKRLKEDPEWNIYEKQTNMSNRKPPQLKNEYKQHLVQFFDKFPQATRRDALVLINMKSPNARSVKSTPAIIETPTTRAIAHTILGSITAPNVISIQIREPLKPKRVKVDGSQKERSLWQNLHEMLYLPPYFSELNPIENFWSIVKNSVKRSAFKETEDLKTRIAEASECVSRKTLHNIAYHSVNNFEKCFNKEPL